MEVAGAEEEERRAEGADDREGRVRSVNINQLDTKFTGSIFIFSLLLGLPKAMKCFDERMVALQTAPATL